MKIDRVSGATTVADRAFAYIGEWLWKSKKNSLNFLLSGLERRSLELLRNYPAMGNIFSLVNEIGKGIDEALRRKVDKNSYLHLVAGSVKRWELGERSARQAIPKLAARAIGPGKTVLTLSSSELVKRTFFALKQEKVKAIVLESRPLREGEATAYALAQAGISTTLIIDLAFPSLEKEVDVVLIGADRIGKTLVNKTGTRLLLEWANWKKKPVFVVCQTSKFIPPSWCVLPLPISPPGEVSRRRSPKLHVRNFYFEETPLELTDAFLTEKGRLLRPAIKRKTAAVETSAWFQRLLKKV